MSKSLVLNPLTKASLLHENGEQATLKLQCFAKRRSFDTIIIKRTKEPGLFTAVLNWLEGARTESLPDLALPRSMELLADGLLITPRELANVPAGVDPELGDGHAMAAALCPAIAGLLRDGPVLPSAPDEPDPGLAELGYCTLPSILTRNDTLCLQTYYRTLSAGDWLIPGSEQVANRKQIHNDPVARRVLCALTPYFAAKLGQKIKPSYSFAAEYYDCAELAPHTDREQCVFTFSLYLGYQPEPENDTCPWPLTVHTPQGDKIVSQQLGGGLLLRGRELPHSRDPIPPGHKAQMLFLHYVPEAFTGSLD